jgi:hypothetical protein
MYRSCLDELEKLGAVNHQQAQAALENLDQLERNKTTPDQALRYGAFGAGMGVAAGGVTDMIRGKKMSELYEGLPGVKGGRLRNVAALAAGGAIAGGALPLLRQHMDRHLEMGKLRKFMQENQPQRAPEPDDGKIVGPTHGAGMTVTASAKGSEDRKEVLSLPWTGPNYNRNVLLGGLGTGLATAAGVGLATKDIGAAAISGLLGTIPGMIGGHAYTPHGTIHLYGGGSAVSKPSPATRLLHGKTASAKLATFTESQYSGGTGGPPFVLVAGLANKAPPRLDAPLGLESELRKKQGQVKLAFMGQKGSTPAGHLSSGSVQAGPRTTAPAGPTVASISKPRDPKISHLAGVTMPKLNGWGRPIPGAMK